MTAGCLGIALFGIAADLIGQQLPSVSNAALGATPFWDDILPAVISVAIATLPLLILIEHRKTAELRLWLLLATEVSAAVTSRDVANGLLLGNCGRSYYGAMGCSAVQGDALTFFFLISGMLQCAGLYLIVTSGKNIGRSGIPKFKRFMFILITVLYGLVALFGNDPFGFL